MGYRMMGMGCETGAGAGALSSLGPHPDPVPDSRGFFRNWWPKYTKFPIPYGHDMVIKNGLLVLDISSPPHFRRASDLVRDAEKYGLDVYRDPGKEINGSIWPDKFINAKASGDSKAPLVPLPYGPTPKPTYPPEAPYTDWDYRHGWRWQDSKPGFWRPVDVWLPISLAKSAIIGDTANTLTITDPVTGLQEEYFTAVDPDTGKKTTWKVPPGSGAGHQSIAEKVAAAKLAAEENGEPGIPTAEGSTALPTWAILLGLGILGYVLLAPKGKRP